MRRLLFTVATIAMLGLGCATLDNFFRSIRPLPFQMPPGSTTIPGGYARASALAVNSFIIEFLKAPERQDDPLFQCLARPEVYDIHVGYDVPRDRYVVTLVTLEERCLQPPAHLNHGTAYFEYDGTTFELMKRVWGEEEWVSHPGDGGLDGGDANVPPDAGGTTAPRDAARDGGAFP